MDETRLVMPSQIPWDELKGKDLEECVYPLWDPLRDHPRFQALLEMYDEGQ